MGQRLDGYETLVIGPVEIYLLLADLVNPAEERARLEKELEEARQQVKRVEKLLKSEFGKKAPAEVISKEKARLEGFRASAKSLEAQLKNQK